METRKKRVFLTRISAEEYADIVASGSFDRAIEALRPYVRKVSGPAPTVGLRAMTQEERREYNRRRKAAERERKRAKP